MANKYFKIDYEDAKSFLESLPEENLKDLFDIYNISDEFVFAGSLIDKVSSLAEIISDEDLFQLGYKEEIKENVEEEGTKIYDFCTSVDSVVNFLQTLDDYTLDELYSKYGTHDLEEIAIAITDTELEKLGMQIKTDIPQFPAEDVTIPNLNCSEYAQCNYCEDLDYLEDLPLDIPCYVVDADKGLFMTDNLYSFSNIKSALDPHLVSTCDLYNEDIIDSNVLFVITPITYPEQINEEVVINSELNPELFDNETQLLKEDVLNSLQEYATGFTDKLQSKDIPVEYSDIILIGSNAGYLYTPESDIDVHFVWVKPLDNDIFELMKAEILDYVTENPLQIGSNMVELNIEDGFNMESTSKRKYSICDNCWIDNSNTEEVYTPEDLSKVEGYEEQVEDYTKQIEDVITSDSYADAVALKNEIRLNRSTDLAEKGSLSMGNVVFKELRNNGEFGKLREYIKEKELGAPVTLNEDEV